MIYKRVVYRLAMFWCRVNKAWRGKIGEKTIRRLTVRTGRLPFRAVGLETKDLQRNLSKRGKGVLTWV